MTASFSLTVVEPARERAAPAYAAASPVSFIEASTNRKLSPVGADGKPRAPFCSSTYASIEATCPTSCAFRGADCYAEVGFTRHALARMDRVARAGKLRRELTGEE